MKKLLIFLLLIGLFACNHTQKTKPQKKEVNQVTLKSYYKSGILRTSTMTVTYSDTINVVTTVWNYHKGDSNFIAYPGGMVSNHIIHIISDSVNYWYVPFDPMDVPCKMLMGNYEMFCLCGGHGSCEVDDKVNSSSCLSKATDPCTVCLIGIEVIPGNLKQAGVIIRAKNLRYNGELYQ